MIHDVRVEITCDGEKCRESIEVMPDFTYLNYFGSGGSYDCSVLARKIRAEGWTIDDGKHYCESCSHIGPAQVLKACLLAKRRRKANKIRCRRLRPDAEGLLIFN